MTGNLALVSTQTNARAVGRRAAAVVASTVAAVAASAVVTGPASADVPQGWEQAPHMSGLDLLVFILFIPLAVGIVISLLTLLPGVLRGEGLIPKVEADDDERVPATIDHH